PTVSSLCLLPLGAAATPAIPAGARWVAADGLAQPGPRQPQGPRLARRGPRRRGAGGCDVGLARRAHGSERASVARKLRWWAGSSGDGWPVLPYFDLVSFTAILTLIFPFCSADSNFYFLMTAAPSPLQHVRQAWRPCQSLEPSYSPFVPGSEG
ncbi:unnamed protein product, partial [Urochloa humidicola]